MQSEVNSGLWLFTLCSAIALSALPACQVPSSRAVSVAVSRQKTPPAPPRDEPQLTLAYCVPRVANSDNSAFTLDYDGSDGTREPRFTPGLTPESNDGVARALTKFSRGATELCLAADELSENQTPGKAAAEKPTFRRYVLRVPIDAQLNHLDEYVRFAARSGFDQPIFKTKQATVVAQIANTEYSYSPATAEPVTATIGTTTIEVNASGDYELRARVTDGYEQSVPIGLVVVPPNPDLADCDSKLAESVRQLCSHEAHPCDRLTLVGVNDIGMLLAVTSYLQSVAEVGEPALAFQQRHIGLDASPYLDGSFRRAHRIRRFFAAIQPEPDMRKLAAAESLAKKKFGLHSPVPTSLVAETVWHRELMSKLTAGEWTELGKTRPCEQPGRTAASLVVDKDQRVRLYSERVSVTEKSELLLRVYYDETQRPRLVVNSESTDSDDSWDAYLVLDEKGCPVSERLATGSELSSTMLHWELKQLLNPTVAYSEPLCIGQLP